MDVSATMIYTHLLQQGGQGDPSSVENRQWKPTVREGKAT